MRAKICLPECKEEVGRGVVSGAMSDSYPKLLSSFDLSGLRLGNRVVMAPMTRARSGTSRIPNHLMAQYYAQRASTGLIISEATTVSEQGNGWNHSPGIYTDVMAAAWGLIPTAVHERGGHIFLQLWHCGRASHSSFHDGKPAVAPSAIKIEGEAIHTPKGKEPYETPRPLETGEISGVIEDYRRAAERAKQAGFDGVEIHAANGYLLDTFLQSKTNHRTDAYGGSLENRTRLLLEIVEALVTVWPANRVGVRFSPNGNFNDMGSPDFREQFLFAASRLDAFGLAYLHVMDGLGFGFHELGEPMRLAEFREVFHGPLIGNTGYDPAGAEARIAAGEADLIAIGRPLISNPDYVERLVNGWPLAEDAPMSAWYSDQGALGYTDFSRYPGR